MARIFPTVGAWFHETETNLNFEIVAIDEHTSTIEIQYESGELSELELDSWGQLGATRITSNEMGVDPHFNDDLGVNLDDAPIQHTQSSALNDLDTPYYHGIDEL